MTDAEMKQLAKEICKEIKEEAAKCPFGLTSDQAEAIKQIADGYNLSKKTIWKGIWKGIGWIFLLAIVYGLFDQLANIVKSIKQ